MHLVLKRETVRELAGREIGAARGGNPSLAVACLVSLQVLTICATCPNVAGKTNDFTCPVCSLPVVQTCTI
jgi:hypothetical protein